MKMSTILIILFLFIFIVVVVFATIDNNEILDITDGIYCKYFSNCTLNKINITSQLCLNNTCINNFSFSTSSTTTKYNSSLWYIRNNVITSNSSIGKGNVAITGNVTARSGIFNDTMPKLDLKEGYPNCRVGTSSPISGSGRITLEYYDPALNTIWQIDNGGNNLRFFNLNTVYARINQTGIYEGTPANRVCTAANGLCSSASTYNANGTWYKSVYGFTSNNSNGKKGNVYITGNLSMKKGNAYIGNVSIIASTRWNDTAPLQIYNNLNRSQTTILQLIGNNRTKAADNDRTYIDFMGQNLTRYRNFSRIESRIVDWTAATEDSSIYFWVRTAGAWTNPLSLTGTTATAGTFSGTGAFTTATSSTSETIATSGTTATASTAFKLAKQSMSYRFAVSNVSAGAMTVSYSAASAVIYPKWTEGASGNHNLIAGLAIVAGKTPITAGAGTLGNTTMLYIQGSMNGVVTGENRGIWVENASTRLIGNVTIGLALQFLNRTQAIVPACNVKSNGSLSRNTNGLIYCNGVKWRNVSLGS